MESSSLYDIWQTDYGRDFAAGVRLLALYNPKAVTQKTMLRLQVLASSPGEFITDYDQGKLEAALRDTDMASCKELSPLRSAPETRNTHPETRNPHPETQNTHPETRNPPTATPTTRALHKLHSHHHALMVSAGTDEERGAQARKIMREILPALDAEYDKQRNPTPVPSPEGRGDGESAERLPPPFGGGDGGGVEMMKRLASLRTRIARLKNHLIPDAKNTKRRAQLEKELLEKTADKERIEKELAA